MANAVPKRIQEFADGRLCARRALEEFGVTNFPIRMARDRQPVWPDSLIGSITHTAGLCAAVVAERASGLRPRRVLETAAGTGVVVANPASRASSLLCPLRHALSV